MNISALDLIFDWDTLGIVFAPVSYTHLDVYKRQLHNRRRSGNRRRFQRQYQHLLKAALSILKSLSFVHNPAHRSGIPHGSHFQAGHFLYFRSIR